MRRPACGGGAPSVTRRLWLIVALASVMWVAGCAMTSPDFEEVGTVTRVSTAQDAAIDSVDTSAEESGTAVTGLSEETIEAVDLIEPLDEWVQLRGTTLEALGPTQRLVFDLSRMPDSVSHFQLGNPPRLVLDLRGPHEPARSVDRYPTENDLVKRVRVGHYDGRMRLVVDLNQPLPDTYAVREEGNALVVYIGDLGDIAAAAGESDGGAAGSNDDDVAVDQQPESASALAEPDEPPLRDEDAAARVPEDDEAEHTESPEPSSPARLAKLTKAPSPDQAVKKKRYTGKRISLDFKDADVQNVLRVIADVSGLNIVATDDVTGRITLHLVNVPWDQALEVVLEANRLKMIREGNVVRVSTVDRVREEQEALRAQRDAAAELEALQVRYVRVNYARADEILLEKVQGVLTERGSASFDERTNTIIIRDISAGIAASVELISKLDVQSPQVLIEANIVEGTTDFARALGVQWGYRYLAGPQTGNPTGSDFPGTVDASGGGLGLGKPAPSAGAGPQPLVPLMADFPVPSNFGPGFGPGSGSAFDLALGSISGSDTLSARLTALEEEGKGRIISRPRVITLNNIPASIQSLTILRVRLPSTGTVVNTGTGGVAGTASTATEKIETGIILIVTPQVSSDGFVLLNIRAKTSQADFSRTVDQIPTEIAREATSNVLISDGETVVLGGIFRNEANDAETGIPYLRSVPFLGWLFKRNLKQDRKEELLVFITPQVVAGHGNELPSATQLWENRSGG